MEEIYAKIALLREERAKVPLDSEEYKQLTAQMSELYKEVTRDPHGIHWHAT